MSGKFITVEGGEGTGKSTQVRLLAEALRGVGREVLVTREPGGSSGAEEIRRLLVDGPTGRWDAMTEALLHFAARRDHLQKRIWPALEQGVWVICDRFADSTTAYQGAGQGLEASVIADLYRTVVGDFRPDLTLILDMPEATGLARAHSRGGGEDRYERMGASFHHRLHQAFRAIAKAHPERCQLITAEGDVGQVHEAIKAVVTQRLGLEIP